MKLRLMICAMAASTALFATDVTSYTYGVLAVSDTTSSNTVVGVPWRQVSESATTSDISLSNLVSTAMLAAGDIVYLYEGGTWKGYTLLASGVWDPMTTINGKDVTSPGSADAKTFSRGAGLIIQRASNTDPIYLCGRYEAIVGLNSTIPAGTMVLIANPLTGDKEITVGAVGDQIRIPQDGGAMKIYEKRAAGWGTYSAQTVGGRTVKKWSACGCSLPAGTGAFYVNNGSEDVVVSW